jgi:2-dehydro-3-deoxyphosphooctonate aldolase (KDO 8-P synthase)
MQPTKEFSIGSVKVGGAQPQILIAGPCVIESEAHATMIAERLKEIAARAGVPLIFKASYDKANRTSVNSYRGPGMEEGLRILKNIRKRTGLPVLTDVHEVAQVAPVAQVCDVLQIPAFLCRQTDLLVAAGKSGRAVNLKKGQFVSPWEMKNAVEKVAGTGNEQILLTERGSSFGYNNLVVDMRSFSVMRSFGFPVIFDVTHSVQLPGATGQASGGQPEFIAPLARAGTAAGIDGLFLEVHENPAKALSDGTNALPLAELAALLERITRLAALVREPQTKAHTQDHKA